MEITHDCPHDNSTFETRYDNILKCHYYVCHCYECGRDYYPETKEDEKEFWEREINSSSYIRADD